MDSSSEEIVWRPSPDLIESCHLTRFMRRHQLASFEKLMARSTTDIEWFWGAMLRELDVRFETPYSKVVDLSNGPQMPRWCVDGRMNIVQTLLDRHQETRQDDRIAIVYESENGETRRLTYRELREEVNRVASALRSLQIVPGDVVAVFMPMTPQCVIAMLAIIKIGAIFLPLFSGYGAGAIVSRLVDCNAKAMFTVDGFRRRGQCVDTKTIADEAASSSPSIQHLIVFQNANNPVSMKPDRDHWWHDIVKPTYSSNSKSPTHITSAEASCMLIYTSGTTGKPKGAVHTHCGFPIKSAQDMLHGFDVREDELIYWITDIGWMMGPWLIFGSLLCKSSMLLYDGAMDFPANDRLWSIVERHKVTALGVSPTLIRALRKFGDEPVKKHDLSSLRKFGSTGEPWNDEPWKWLFEVVGNSKLPIWNYSGGTEISGGILAGNMITPLRPTAFAGPLPGMAADVVDDQGNPVRGKVGELVIRKPWIGMTRSFWNDHDRYLDTYWSRVKDIWFHGDFASIDELGLWYIHGRSDDTIKVAGKRLGPAEIESILVSHPSISEAAAIGVPDELKGQALVCFAVLKPGFTASESLQKELIALIVKEQGKPLAPKSLLFVNDLPKTRNAKVMRRVIRAAYLDEPVGDVSSLENPGAVEECRKRG